MVYQQESEISQSHAMALLTEYISLYLSNIIYSSYIYRTELINMWYVRHKESNEPWVGSRGKVKEVDVRQMLVYLIEVYEGWGEGGTPKVK